MNKHQEKNINFKDCYSIFKGAMEKQGRLDLRRIYTDGLVMWLGVYQELELASCRGSLEELNSERAYALMGDCKRKREMNLSGNTSALIQARQKITRDTLMEALHGLYQDASRGLNWKGYRLYGIDGSTVSLNQSTAQLRKAFPGAEGNKSRSRWPIVHLVILVDLLEGLLASASIGAKYGKRAQGEQELALAFREIVSENSLVLGDRNFGMFNIAKEFTNKGCKVLLRLSPHIAQSMAGGNSLTDGMDLPVKWKASYEVSKRWGYQQGDIVEGRLIGKSFMHNGKLHNVYLFTDLKEGDVSELSELYKKRWMIEEDIKSLKLRLRLKDIQAATKEAVEVELFCKMMAYNITRACILLAVDGTDIDPRRISFANALVIVRSGLAALTFMESASAKDNAIDKILSRIRKCTNPVRPNRSYPREVYRKWPTGKYEIRSSAIAKKT